MTDSIIPASLLSPILGGLVGARCVEQEERLLGAARAAGEDQLEAGPFNGGHQLRRRGLAGVQRQERERGLERLAGEDLMIRDRREGVLDRLIKLGVVQRGDVLEAGDDPSAAAQGPHLGAHLRRIMAGIRGAEAFRGLGGLRDNVLGGLFSDGGVHGITLFLDPYHYGPSPNVL